MNKGQYCLLSAAHGLTHVNHTNFGKEINTQSDSSGDYQPMLGTTVEDQMDFVLYNSPQVPSLSMGHYHPRTRITEIDNGPVNF